MNITINVNHVNNYCLRNQRDTWQGRYINVNNGGRIERYHSTGEINDCFLSQMAHVLSSLWRHRLIDSTSQPNPTKQNVSSTINWFRLTRRGFSVVTSLTASGSFHPFSPSFLFYFILFFFSVSLFLSILKIIFVGSFFPQSAKSRSKEAVHLWPSCCRSLSSCGLGGSTTRMDNFPILMRFSTWFP